jgi:hypothetical protein
MPRNGNDYAISGVSESPYKGAGQRNVIAATEISMSSGLHNLGTGGGFYLGDDFAGERMLLAEISNKAH